MKEIDNEKLKREVWICGDAEVPVGKMRRKVAELFCGDRSGIS